MKQPYPQQHNKPVTTQIQQVQYSSPLPLSSEVANYEKLVPGAAERILVTFEKQVEHRHFIEKYNIKLNGISLYLSVLIVVLLGGASTFLAMQGHETTASILGGTTLLGVFTSLIRAFTQKKK